MHTESVELATLDDVEVVLVEAALEATLVFTVDDVPVLVEPKLVDTDVLEATVATEVVVVLDNDVEEIAEAVMVVELDEVLLVCVSARTTDPELNDSSRTIKLMVTRIGTLIFPLKLPPARNRRFPSHSVQPTTDRS